MTTRNRGKRSDDDELFGNKKVVPILKDAVSDMCYLLSRHYPENATSVLVGNRYKLKARQIQMLKGSAASILQIQNRKEKQLNIVSIRPTTYLSFQKSFYSGVVLQFG